MLTGVIERKALEQSLIDEEDEEIDDDARYLNLEGEDDGDDMSFSCRADELNVLSFRGRLG